ERYIRVSSRIKPGLRHSSLKGFMINVSVMYPNKPGAHFDISYYCVKHIPLVQKVLGPALLKVVVEEGIAGMGPGARAIPCSWASLLRIGGLVPGSPWASPGSNSGRYPKLH